MPTKGKKTLKHKKNTSLARRPPSYTPDDSASSATEKPRSPDEVNHKTHSRERSPPQEDYASDEYSSSNEEHSQKYPLEKIRELLHHWDKQQKKHPRKKRNRRNYLKKECGRKRRTRKTSRASSKTHSPQRKQKKRRKHSSKPKPRVKEEESSSTPSADCDSQAAEPVPDLEAPLPLALTTPFPLCEWTLRAKLSVMHLEQCSWIIGQLRLHSQVTEITKEETTEVPQPHITLRIKGSQKALYDTQAELAANGFHDVIWQEDPSVPSSALTPNYRRTTHWEPTKTYSPHSRTLDPSKNSKYAWEKAKPDGLSRNGVIKTIMEKGIYGFIKTETDDDIFVLPSACIGFPDPLREGRNIIPPVGTKVIFEMGTDAKTGKDKAILVGLDQTERSATQRKHHSKPNPIGA